MFERDAKSLAISIKLKKDHLQLFLFPWYIQGILRYVLA